MCFSLWAFFLLPCRRALTAWPVYTVKLVTMAMWRSVVKSSSTSTTSTKQEPSTSWWRAAGTWPLQTRGSKGQMRKHREEFPWALLRVSPTTSHPDCNQGLGFGPGNSQDPVGKSSIFGDCLVLMPCGKGIFGVLLRAICVCSGETIRLFKLPTYLILKGEKKRRNRQAAWSFFYFYNQNWSFMKVIWKERCSGGKHKWK